MKIVLALLVSSTAVAAPITIVSSTGVTLTAAPAASAFCNASARALLLLRSGELIAIDGRGSSTTLHAFGPVAGRLAMTCDGRDHVVIAGGGQLTMFDGQTSSTLGGPGPTLAGRVVDDGASVFVAQNGMVWRWDGTRLTSWRASAGISGDATAAIGHDGTSVAVVAREHVTVYMADGTSHPGPTATGATWASDGRSLLVDGATGLQRWTPSKSVDHRGRDGRPVLRLDKLDSTLAGARLLASDRYVIAASPSRLDIRTIDAAGQVGSPVVVSRVPFEAVTCVFGDKPFAIVADEHTAWVADLSRSSDLIDRAYPMDALRALAFSPDGKALAFLGGNADVLVVSTDGHTMNLRAGSGTHVLAAESGWLDNARLAWRGDDTIVAAGPGLAMQWRRDGTTRIERGDWTIGLSPLGEAIVLAPEKHVVVRRTPPITFLASRDPRASIVAADLAGDLLAVRAFKRLEIWDLARPMLAPVVTIKPTHWLGQAVLVGGRPAALFSDARTVYLVDSKGERTVETLPALIVAMAASPDRRRVAVGCSDGTVSIYDASGIKVLSSRTSGSITALAWSPDGNHLAVAAARRIEMW